MKHILTKTELRYLESLLSLIDDYEMDFPLGYIHEQIKLMREIYKRKYINVGVELDGTLKNSYEDEAEVINSWRGWYTITIKDRRIK